MYQSPSARSSQEVYARGVEIAQATEELGFSTIWLAEHHFSTYCYLSRPLMMALHIADRTRHLRIGTAVIVVPLYHPLVVAEEIATADQLMGGRLDVGLGRGYERYVFDRLGIRLEESWARWEEAVDIILKALSGESFSYQGRFYSFPESYIFPEPLQKPYPPIWVVGQTQRPESIVTAVRQGFGILGGGSAVSVEQLEELGQLVKQTAEEVALPTGPNLAVQRWVYVTDDEDEARQVAEQYGRWGSRVARALAKGEAKIDHGRPVVEPKENEEDIDALLGRNVIGTPETCIKQIEHLRDRVGIQHFMCNFWFGDLPQEKVLRSMELFARKVKPKFEEKAPVR